MDQLKRRICATIFQGTALTAMACTSTPQTTEQGTLITKKEPITVAKVELKKPKNTCGLPHDPTFKKTTFPTTDEEVSYSHRRLVCVTFDELNKQGLTCASITAKNASKLLGKYSRGCGGLYLSTNPDVCGPVDRPNKDCCVAMNVRRRHCIRGRPFIVEGMLRTTSSARREGWLDQRADVVDWSTVETLPGHLRQDIAAAWAVDGCHEHASIASFSAFMMDLLAVGAPKELVAQTTQAIADEIDHAARCFTIASAYAGFPLGPEPLDTTQGGVKSLEEILRAAIEEGCIGETCAAAEANEARQYAAHAYVQETLDIIGEDETMHALLAWSFVDWVLSTRPDLVDVARDAFINSPMAVEVTWLAGETATSLAMRQHGCFSEPAIDQIRSRAYKNVVLPCAHMLFEKHTPDTQALRLT